MRRIIIKEARPGMSIARVLGDPKAPGHPVAQPGEILTAERLWQLHDLGVYDLWVNDLGLEFFDDLCSAQQSVPQQRLAAALRESFLYFAGVMPRAVFKRHGILLEELLSALVKAAPAVPHFAALTEDDGLLAHCSDVTALAILIGTQLEEYLVEQRKRLNCRQARDLINLGLGCLFHDVGELMLPAGQRESRLALSPLHEDTGIGEAWKQHTDEGYALARGRLDPSAAVILQHHHQHFDGSGFAGPAAPQGSARTQRGTGIHVYARIAMAADVFCQLHFAGSAGAAGARAHVPQPMIKTVWEMQRTSIYAWFDPIVHKALLSLLPPVVEGMVVTLSDSRQAVVTHVDAAFPCQPEVRVLHDPGTTDDGADSGSPGERVNLLGAPLELAAVDGADVSLYSGTAGRHEPLVAA